jgi:hypothetical protein
VIVVKNNPIGMDYYIQQAQSRLYDELCRVWGTTDYNCYGRVDRIKDTNGAYSAYVTGADGKLTDAYWDASKKAVSFFGVSGPIQHMGGKANHRADIHLVFFVNLKSLKPGITHRADEEVRLDVLNALGEKSYGLEYKSTELWIENALKEYGGSKARYLQFFDIADTHIFRLNYTLLFDPNKQTLKFK